jgi:organic radical activating enzyme
MKIKEIFESYQGEGSMVGVYATFIRLAGCNLSCKFCDTDFSGGEEMNIVTPPTEWIWLTGGEPLMQDVAPWVDLWRGWGKKVAVETNGCYKLPTKFDHVTLSPKVKYSELKLTECDDLKIVTPTYKPEDFAEVRAVNRFIQPEHGTKIPKSLPKGWRLSMQNHKYWGVK